MSIKATVTETTIRIEVDRSTPLDIGAWWDTLAALDLPGELDGRQVR